MITITKTQYDELKKDSFKLKCLESGGVDNWEWYHESLKRYYKKYPDPDYDDNYDDDDDVK